MPKITGVDFQSPYFAHGGMSTQALPIRTHADVMRAIEDQELGKDDEVIDLHTYPTTPYFAYRPGMKKLRKPKEDGVLKRIGRKFNAVWGDN